MFLHASERWRRIILKINEGSQIAATFLKKNSHDCSVAKLYLTLCDPVDCSMPAFPVLHYLPGFAQIHGHWVSDALLLPSVFPSNSYFPMSWLFASGGQSIRASSSATVLPMNIQGWFPLGLAGLILQSKGLSRVFSSTTLPKHQFLHAQPSLWSNSYIRTLQLEKSSLWLYGPLSAKWCMSLLFNTLSRFVIAFLLRSKSL